MNSRQETHTESLELQIVKLAFFIVSYLAIIEISTTKASTTSITNIYQFNIDMRSVLVFVITAWIDCLEWTSSQEHFYQGTLSLLYERRRKRNMIGGVLGIFLVPACFMLLFTNTTSVDIAVAAQLALGVSITFIIIKMFSVIELINFRYRKREGQKR